MKKRPVFAGICLSLLSHLVTWLAMGVPNYFGYADAGMIIALLLLGLHMILFGFLNYRAHFVADTFKRGMYFSVAFLLAGALLLIGETVFVATADLGTLEPHSSFFAGLGYVIFWIVWLVAFGADVVLVLLQSLVRVCRIRRENKRL